MNIEFVIKDLQNNSSLEELEWKLNSTDASSSKDDLLSIQSQADQFKQNALIFISKKQYSKKDLKEMHTLLYKAYKAQIEFPLQKQLINILKSYSWVIKLEMMLNDLDTTSDKNKDFGLFSEKCETCFLFRRDLDRTISFCLKRLKEEDLMPYLDEHYIIFRNIMHEGEDVLHSDMRIRELYECYCKKLWFIQANNMKRSVLPIDPNELVKLHEQAQCYKIDTFSESYLWIVEKFCRYNTWINIFMNSIYHQDLIDICKPERIYENYEIVQGLIQEYSKLNIQLDYLNNEIIYVASAIEWLFKAQHLERELQDNKKITYSALEEFYQIAVNLDLPPTLQHYKKISCLYEDTLRLINDSSECFSCITKFDPSAETPSSPKLLLSNLRLRCCIDPKNGYFKTAYYERVERMFLYNKALHLYQRLQKSKINFDKDLTTLNTFLKKLDSWEKELAQKWDKYKFETFLLSCEEFPAKTYLSCIQNIVSDIDGLKFKLGNQIFFKLESHSQIFIVEWCLAALIFLNKKSLTLLIPPHIRPSTMSDNIEKLEVWKSLLNSLNQFEDHLCPLLVNQIKQSYIYNRFLKETTEAEHYVKVVSELKFLQSSLNQHFTGSYQEMLLKYQNRSHLISLDRYGVLIKEMKTKNPCLDDQVKYLNEIINTYKDLLKQCESLKPPQDQSLHLKFDKVDKSVLEKLFRGFLILPIKYNKEDKNIIFVNSIIKSFDDLEADFKRMKEYQSEMNQKTLDYRDVSLILNKYSSSLIKHTEIEEIIKNYQDGQNLLEDSETLLKQKHSTNEQIVQKYEEITHIKIDFGSRTEKVRLKFWHMIIEIIQSQCYPTGKKLDKEFELNYHILMCLVEDTAKVLKQQQLLINFTFQEKEIFNITKMLGSLLNKVANKLKALYHLQDIKRIEKLNFYVDEIINIRPEIETHIQNLKQKNGEPIPKMENSNNNLLSNKELVDLAIPGNINSLSTNIHGNSTELNKVLNDKVILAAKNEEKTVMKRKEKEVLISEDNKSNKRKCMDIINNAEEEHEVDNEVGDKKLKTESGEVRMHNKSEISSKRREAVVRQLGILMEQNTHFTQPANKEKVFAKLAAGIEEKIFSLSSHNLELYNSSINQHSAFFSKLKNFKNISKSLSRCQFESTGTKYLLNNMVIFNSIEKSLKGSNAKSLMKFVKQNKISSLETSIIPQYDLPISDNLLVQTEKEEHERRHSCIKTSLTDLKKEDICTAKVLNEEAKPNKFLEDLEEQENNFSTNDAIESTTSLLDPDYSSKHSLNKSEEELNESFMINDKTYQENIKLMQEMDAQAQMSSKKEKLIYQVFSFTFLLLF